MSYTVTKPAKAISAIIFDVLNKAFVPKINKETKVIADDVCQKLKDKIRDGSFNFSSTAPYDEEYAKWKEKAHPGAPYLMLSGDYVEAIEVKKTENGYTIGVRDDAHFSDRGGTPVDMRTLAYILEYGWPEKHIKPRPHWRPALANLRRRNRNLSQEMKKQATKEANEALKQYLSQPQVRSNR